MDKMYKLDGVKPPACWEDKQSFKINHGLVEIFKKACQSGKFMGKELQEMLFPKGKQCVFLSHAHDDFSKACYVKAVIESQMSQYEVFIDSLYWQHVRKAQAKLEKEYRADSVAEHLHAMLFTALAQMIQSCKCFIFVETEGSITMSDVRGSRYTHSPWIYFELQMASLLLKQRKIGRLDESFGLESQDFKPMPCYYGVEDILASGRMTPIKLEELLKKLSGIA
ncbi:hypothetical protein [Helicobacter cynogastricus]|uniref:hypothetical protein n=1 Tax=Helicobacter cynogastricus TaxID=329937 RepID=UPI000CF0F9DD|nr:hypothetical protein [Helicobacter cynogastricus]